MKYFVLTTRGLENLVLEDLKESLNEIKILSINYRRIIFNYNGNTKNLLMLRSVDDVFVYIKSFNVNHYRKSLKNFEINVKTIYFNKIVDFIKKFRNISKPVTFSITLSNIGKKNYTPDEI